MNTLFNVIVCFVLILLQTTLMPLSRMFSNFFDLLIPLIVYLGLLCSFRNSLPVLIGAGYAMDAFSGGPFGVYITTYIWICLGVKWLTGYVHARSELLWLCVVPAAVLVQNLIILVVTGLLAWSMPSYDQILDLVAIQLFWASLLGPIFLIAIYYSKILWQSHVAGRFFKGALDKS